MTSAIDEIWESERRLLLDVAYRMLGTITEAEDVVQEAFARLLRADIDAIDDVRAWLVVVVSRLCVDQLRSAYARREQSAGAWLPEPLVDARGAVIDPADRVTLDDSVRIALLVVLEQLSPAERAAFVLHDVFQFSFETISAIVGRSPDACRQLASRARKHVKDNVRPARFDVEPAMHREAVDRFIAACTSGDLNALLAVLDPHVEGVADVGVRRLPFSTTAVGADEVAGRLLALFGPQTPMTLEARNVNGELGVVALRHQHVFAVMSLSTAGGRVTEIHSIADPDKLRRVPE